jgi:2-octaprenylphenol hydroxylase
VPVEYDVMVLGGGIVGLTAALMMRQQGHEVVLVDAKSIAQADPLRAYALNQASQTLLVSLGVWGDHLSAARYEHMHVWDGATGAAIDFDARMIAANQLGVIVTEVSLKALLVEKLKASGVKLIEHVVIENVREDAEGCVLQCGAETWRAALLVIADGANSRAREALGVVMTRYSYEQTAVVATIETAFSHQKTAWQIFNPQGFTGDRSGILAFLPLQPPHQCSIVFSTTQAEADHWVTSDEASFNVQLTRAFENKLGACQVISPRVQFPLMMRHVKQYSGRHWLLMGDAAHTIHPLAGQGLNIGLADVAAWQRLLMGRKLSANLLARYQRERKTAVWQMVVQMEALKRVFETRLMPLVALRHLGLRMVNQQAFLKRFFIEQACDRC